MTARRPCRVATSAAARPVIQPSRSFTEPAENFVRSGNMASKDSSTTRCRAARTGSRLTSGVSAAACRSAASVASESRSPIRWA